MQVSEFCNILKALSAAFPKGGIVTANGEFVANKRTNAYFCLTSCENAIDVKCKVLEWLSRDCFKSQAYSSDAANNRYHAEMLASVNKFLGTWFTFEDMELIYHKLGNCVNHELTEAFVLSGYDMHILEADNERI